MADDVEGRIRDLERDHGDLKQKVAVSDVKLDHVSADTAAIRADIKKLVWLIVGALVAAAMGFVIKGGLNV